MMERTTPENINLTELADLLSEADPAALLIRKRLLRRVLWQHTPSRAHGFGLFRRQYYVINRTHLLHIVESDELAPYAAATLPDLVILLGRSNELILGPQPRDETLLQYWRLLFRARVELALREKFTAEKLTEADIQPRIERLGRAEFDEATAVLIQDHSLLAADGVAAAWIQFVAQYLELYFFAPQQLFIYFPALAGRDGLNALVLQELDADALFKQTRLRGAPDPLVEAAAAERQPAVPPSHHAAPGMNGQAERAERDGNNVRAALFYVRLAEQSDKGDAQRQAHQQLRGLARRLRVALGQPEASAEEWFQALEPLLFPAAHGYWPAEARLLYDLQKVCLDHERELTSVSVLRWLVTLGRQPVRKLVPGQQLVLMLQDLHNAGKRLQTMTLAVPDRQRLEHTLTAATHHQEKTVRDYFRPLLLGAMTAVGLAPANVPETVSRDKLVEELLDRLAGRGLITMSDLRDALSRNQLKLNDLAGPGDFLLGDTLLRLNSELAGRMDNVYRPGEFYLRWMQSLSALLFATPWGRLLTRYVLLPFGGAFIALKFCFFMYQEIGHFLPKLPIDDSDTNIVIVQQADPHVPAQIVAESKKNGDHVVGQIVLDDDDFPFLEWFRDERHEEARSQFPWDPLTTPWSLAILGVFVFLMLYVPPFRRVVLRGLVATGKGLKRALIDFPAWVVELPPVRAVVQSFPVRLAARFLLKPLIGAALVAVLAYLLRAQLPTIEIAAGVFFVAAVLLLATRFGRVMDEILSNWLLEGAQNFGYEIIPAVLQSVADLFKWLMSGLERVLYGVDEWFRFRRQENPVTGFFKSMVGILWLAVSYVVRFLMVLIIEPTINPVKHFPMVTVAGKFMLLVAEPLHRALHPVVGPFTAGALTLAIVGGLPGIAGFLLWELKENWRLYRANRPRTLQAVPVGHHGETVVHLLEPGFHSGTVPKTFARWRKAMRKGRARTGRWAEEQLEHTEEAVRRLVERDLLHLLRHAEPTRDLPLAAGRVRLAVTLIRVEIDNRHHPRQPLMLGLELKSGWLLARVLEPGWLEQVSAAERHVILFALAGIYQYAGVALLEEDLRAALASLRPVFDIQDDKLIVWPGGDFHQRLTYSLDNPSPVAPEPDTGSKTENAPTLEVEKLFFSKRPITWTDWVAFWDEQARGASGDTLARTKEASPVLG